MPESERLRLTRETYRAFEARDRTILDYGQWLARHEHNHVEALERFAKRRAR